MSLDNKAEVEFKGLPWPDVNAHARKRPGLYIGSVCRRGLHLVLRNALDRPILDFLSGSGGDIIVCLEADGSVTVSDNGGRSLADLGPLSESRRLEEIFTDVSYPTRCPQLSGKNRFLDAFRVGLGHFLPNAFSETLVAEAIVGGKRYRVCYSYGIQDGPLQVMACDDPDGASMQFKPDPQIFKVTSFDLDQLRQTLLDLAVIFPGLRLTLVNQTSEDPGRWEYLMPEGITQLLSSMIERGETTLRAPLLISKEMAFEGSVFGDKLQMELNVEVCLQFFKASQQTTVSYVNGERNLGGSHLRGLNHGVVRALQAKIISSSRLSPPPQLKCDYPVPGLAAVVSIYLSHPTFEGATKNYLSNREMLNIVCGIVEQELSRYLDEEPVDLSAILAWVAQSPVQPDRILDAIAADGLSNYL